MTAIAKSAKRHPAAKKFCGWEEPAVGLLTPVWGPNDSRAHLI